MTGEQDYRGTRWQEVQEALCLALALRHDAVATSIVEVLGALDEGGWCVYHREDDNGRTT